MADLECASCTQTIAADAANIRCEYCPDANDILQYCSAACKRNDRFQHHDHCTKMYMIEEELKRATKAGVAAQALFYAFIEHTWAYDMQSINVARDADDEEKFQVNVMHSASTDVKGTTTLARTAGGWLFKFPNSAFESVNPQIKKALLADRHSVWAFVFMNIVVQMLFQDLVDDVDRDIKEVVHYLPDNISRIVQHHPTHNPDASTPNHRKDLPYPDEDNHKSLKGVYLITLRSGTSIALDLAGSQFRLPSNDPHQTVTPWPTYTRRWIRSLKYRLPLHSHSNQHAALLPHLRTTTHLALVAEQSSRLNHLATTAEFALGFALADLASGHPAQFDAYTHALLAAVTARLRQHTASDPNATERECPLADLGPMFRFEWANLSKMIMMPSSRVKLAEKKRAKDMKRWRCGYKLPGDERLVFLPDGAPSVLVPGVCVSENPGWGRKK